MTLRGRIDRLESRFGLRRAPLVICFGEPRQEPAPPGDERIPRMVCDGVHGGLQEVPEGAQVIVFGERPDGPQ
jgi:hypothetical protein